MEDVVPFSVFEHVHPGDCCNGHNIVICNAMNRIISAMDYHQMAVNKELNTKYGDDPKSAFIAFCGELYPKRAMLSDYAHFVEHHADPQSTEYIKSRLHFDCDSAAKCGATTRHFRDRRDDDKDGANGVVTNWFIDRMDSIHFLVHHLTELGLRVSAETKESVLGPDDEKQDESLSVELALKRMGREIEAKRAALSTQRLDGTTNSKFTIQIAEQKESGTVQGGDGMLNAHKFEHRESVTMRLANR